MAKAKRETTIPEIGEVEEVLEGIEACERTRRERWIEMERAHSDFKLAKRAYDEAVEGLQRASGVRLEKHPLFDADDGDEPEHGQRTAV
jgi:hypothetical protein